VLTFVFMTELAACYVCTMSRLVFGRSRYVAYKSPLKSGSLIFVTNV